MSLFDCRLMSPNSPNHHLTRNRPSSFEPFEQLETSGQQSETANDSSTSYCVQELTSTPSPSSSKQKSSDRRQQSGIYRGPDVFGKVLGPTADESILVGLQVLMDVAGTLDFANTSATSSQQDNPTQYSNMSTSRDSREATAATSQSSASCRCCSSKCQENAAFNSQEIVTELRRNPCQYIITQENIAASVNTGENKCQQSQARVLPSSMIRYGPEKGDSCFKPNKDVPSNSTMASKKSPVQCNMKTVSSPAKSTPSTPTSPPSPTPPPNCPCSQFYHQTTTISVMEKSPEPAVTFTPSTRKRSLSPIVDNSSPPGPSLCDVSFASEITVPQRNKRVSCDISSVRKINNKPIQTKPQPRPSLHDVEIGTESLASEERASVACVCNLCMPASAGVSSTPSKATNMSKLASVVRFSEDNDRGCACSLCCVPRVKDVKQMKKDSGIPVLRNKSCVCSLIPNGFQTVDAACSSLKVNTSCQYHKCEFVPVESKSTQCKKSTRSRASSTFMCSESGDCRPHKKKSVRIISGPYDCPNFSETGYCMEPKKSVSRTVIPLLDCNDDISRICFEKPTRVCLEMGDSCIPPPMEIRYAITKITKFRDFSTFEVMKSTSKKPKCMPKAVEGVFVLKKEENCCCSKTYE